MSNYEVIARKWRPQSFQQLIGQQHVSQTLLNSIRSERIPHALLFTGPRGTGKTSSARIMAKTLRCTQQKDLVPCQTCQDCTDISQGRHIDVIEIDGASNNGVDSVRELRDTVSYLPSSGRYKIYIIDEVHMLSTSAFNALLKTLEEPPAHVIFVMATTEVQKLPQTILSRCQRFDFRLLSQELIQQQLEKICAKDQIKFDEASLWLIAKAAKGSMRDGQSLLEQLITFTSSNLTSDQVTRILGLSPKELVEDVFKSLIEQNAMGVHTAITTVESLGIEPILFVEDLLELLRNALLIKVSVPHESVNVTEADYESLQKLVPATTVEDIHLTYDLIIEGLSTLSRVSDPLLALEMLLLKTCAAPKVIQLSQLLEGRAHTQAGQPQTATKPIAASNSRPQQKPTNGPRKLAPLRPPGGSSQVSGRTQQPRPSAPAAPVDKWGQFVNKVKTTNGMIGALLEHTYISSETTDSLALGVPRKMSFLVNKLKDADNFQKVEGFVEQHWGRKMNVSFTDEAPKKKTLATPKQREMKKKKEFLDKERELVNNHPMMKKINKDFKTELISIKEDQS